MAKHFALLGNGPISNRGCEAIVLGTKAIVEKAVGPSEFLLASFARDSEEKLPENVHPLALPVSRPRWSRSWFKHRIRRQLGLSEDYSEVVAPLEGKLDSVKAVLSIGGDGYSIDFGHYVVDRLIVMDEYARRLGIPVFIWGASIGPFDKEPEFEKHIIRHFQSVEKIIVRETYTQRYLATLGVQDNVELVPDPAFVLSGTPCEANSELRDFLQAGCIGLNLSPLIAKYATRGDLNEWILSAAKLIERILVVTQRPVLLIYHVTVPDRARRQNMDDLLFLKAVLGAVSPKYRERVELVPENLNASSLKWIISRTSLFIGARTHSTIAALSSQVPCVSIAYSTKAWGINELVYGHTDWVIPSPQLNEKSLSEKLETILEQYEGVKTELNQTMPALIASAFRAGTLLGQAV